MPTFDPNAPVRHDAGIFGLDVAEREAKVVLIPVPWEATTSYGGGTARGPEAILRASHQLDYYDPDVGTPYTAGIHMR
ncbi:MAG: arginase family protein, partial [Deltaproteobacteria bacterium]|nr:arginase family protein [Deltaproteobacteria bacterium]